MTTERNPMQFRVRLWRVTSLYGDGTGTWSTDWVGTLGEARALRDQASVFGLSGLILDEDGFSHG
jgi:hypothetical protein